MSRDVTLSPPFPYFGGKRKIAPVVWRALGRVACYVEPFMGSAAVLLARPDGNRSDRGIEVVNDLDCNVANFWRSIRFKPDETALWAAWPTSHIDLYARRKHLYKHQTELRELLASDIESCDPTMAGIWAWCQCSWLGSGMMNPVAEDGGLGQIPLLHHMEGYRGLPCGAGNGISNEEETTRLFRLLSSRLADVRVLNGDWSRSLGKYLDRSIYGSGVVGVFLDPPYDTDRRDSRCYANDSEDISSKVEEWCFENGSNKSMRIVLCGYGDEHDALLEVGWERFAWSAKKGWVAQGGAENVNRFGESLWLSPACLDIGNDTRNGICHSEAMLSFAME